MNSICICLHTKQKSGIIIVVAKINYIPANVPKRKQEEDMQEKNLKVNFDKNRLHASFLSAARRRAIPMGSRGMDLIRGTVMGILRDNYDFYKAVSQSAKMCKMTGNTVSTEEAFLSMAECFIVSRSIIGGNDDLLEEIEHIMDIGCQNSEDWSKLKVWVEQETKEVVYTVRKDFCYTQACEWISKNGAKKGVRSERMETYFLKNMLFKKLIADDSTERCMYEYAYRTTFMEELDPNKSIEKINLEIFGESTLEKLGNPYELVMQAAEEIYNCNDGKDSAN